MMVWAIVSEKPHGQSQELEVYLYPACLAQYNALDVGYLDFADFKLLKEILAYFLGR
jgi:hypothetical protein